MTEEELHIIERYLHGEMDEAEKQAFEKKLASDPELRASVVNMRATILALGQNILDEKLEILKSEEANFSGVEAKTFRLQPVYKWVALAAVLILGIILIRPLFAPDDTIKNPYIAEHFDSLILHETTRGGNDGIVRTPEQELAYNAYQMQNFHRAIPLLKELWEEKRDTLALFYLRVSEKALRKKSEEDKNYDSILEKSQYNSDLNKIK